MFLGRFPSKDCPVINHRATDVLSKHNNNYLIRAYACVQSWTRVQLLTGFRA
jgi:hypothetical protein